MRRHPFKFFFGLALGVIVFFFLARVFVLALVFAAAMSLVFFVFRKIKNFFKYMTWEDREYSYQNDYRNEFRNLKEFEFWKNHEESFFENEHAPSRERTIIIN